MLRPASKALIVVLAVATLGGCAQLRSMRDRIFKPKAEPVVASAPAEAPVKMELIPFQLGVSSVTVENMAKERGCTGGKGAGLVTEKGPVEVYRMQCENGKTFVARCELRQCKAL